MVKVQLPLHLGLHIIYAAASRASAMPGMDSCEEDIEDSSDHETVSSRCSCFSKAHCCRKRDP